jgi:hypothetical protein
MFLAVLLSNTEGVLSTHSKSGLPLGRRGEGAALISLGAPFRKKESGDEVEIGRFGCCRVSGGALELPGSRGCGRQ